LKKIIQTKSKGALVVLLVVFMCLSLLLTSCTEGAEPTGDSSVGTGSSVPNSQGSLTDNGGDNIKPPRVDITKEWRGSTLNILATTWEGETAMAPWSQPELSAKEGDFSSTAGFGETINSKVVLRNSYVADTFGVTLNWINARSSQVSALLSEARIVGNQKYHIAMPRVKEAQDLVEKGLVYDLAKSEYIDLTKSYYSQAAREAYTVNNRTLFVSGDFSFLDEASSSVTFYNAAMLEGFEAQYVPDFYELVKKGEWSVGEMTSVAMLVRKNSGSPQWTDEDTYGFGTQGLVQLYGYGGIRQVSVDKGQYKLYDGKTNFSEVIEAVLNIKSAEYTRTRWDGDPVDAFVDGRLLFYTGALQSVDYFENQGKTLKAGILPNPKLAKGQDSYYTLVGERAALMCVPKATEDRVMSEAFVEILSQTGQEFIIPAYLEKIKACLDPQIAQQSMEILTDYVFGKAVYDQGYLHGVLDGVFENAHSGASGMLPDNTGIIAEAEKAVAQWNKSWLAYTE